ncbi:MerR family transcriptional regulator [Salmonella enterica subsp. enterica]|nr:MerR family transcriptional regulator [Salmonella enterica subsp. enterica]
MKRWRLHTRSGFVSDINPVTLRVAETLRTLKPQRTDGGHRLFNDADIDRIREIKR